MTPDELVARINIYNGLPMVIGIDGLNGVGKTKVGRKLELRLTASLVSVDHYLDRNRGIYLGALSFADLRRAVSDATNRIVIVEGLCLREVAARSGIGISKHVYIRRLSLTGRWDDEEECCPTNSAEALGGEDVTSRGLHAN